MEDNKPKIIAIIPARGASKNIPQKNIIDLAGKPLMTWTIEQALNTPIIEEVYVSTDDAAIARIAKRSGAQVIWRPTEISGDHDTSESALLNALNYLEYNKHFVPDIVVFLQATSPLRLKNDIEQAIVHFMLENADSLVSVTPMADFLLWERHDEEWKSVNYDYKNRKELRHKKQQFVENGSIFIFKPEILKQYNNRLGGKIAHYTMHFWQTWRVDSPESLSLIEYYFEHRIIPQLIGKIDLNKIQLIIYDFDGVMTNNNSSLDQNGVESVVVNKSDGMVISRIKKLGVQQVILSTETNPVVQKRAEKLGIFCLHGFEDKKVTVENYLKEYYIDKNRVIYFGNDSNDLEVMKYVGYSVAPADAYRKVKKIASYVTRARGGEGVVREFFDFMC